MTLHQTVDNFIHSVDGDDDDIGNNDGYCNAVVRVLFVHGVHTWTFYRTV